MDTTTEAVERYRIGPFSMDPDPIGAWVRYSAYMTLAAERDAAVARAEAAEARLAGLVEALEQIARLNSPEKAWEAYQAKIITRAALAAYEKETCHD